MEIIEALRGIGKKRHVNQLAKGCHDTQIGPPCVLEELVEGLIFDAPIKYLDAFSRSKVPHHARFLTGVRILPNSLLTANERLLGGVSSDADNFDPLS